MKWLFIIIVFAILGLNIFYYMERPTDIVASAAKKTIGTGLETTRTTITSTKTGLEYGIDETEKILGGALTDVEKALDIGIVYKNQQNGVQGNKSQQSEKPGYCYIGKDKGIRSCLFVGVNDECLSDDIYPTMDVCVNPKLRA